MDTLSIRKYSGRNLWPKLVNSFGPRCPRASRDSCTSDKSRTFDQTIKHAIALVAPNRPPMPKTILVVDNELRSRQLIAHLLREEGYQVDEADDGASALEILETKIFDLIISDFVIPPLTSFS